MFSRKRQASTIQPSPALLEAKERYVSHQQYMDDMRQKQSSFRGKLSEIRCRLEEIPVERRNVESLRRNALVRASMDASKQGEVDRYDRQLADLKTEEARLIETKDAIERELVVLDDQLNKAQPRLESVKTAMWAEVAAVMAASVPDTFVPFFRKLWAAMNQARPGIYAVAVLDRLGTAQLADEDRRRLIQELGAEFSIPTD